LLAQLDHFQRLGGDAVEQAGARGGHDEWAGHALVVVVGAVEDGPGAVGLR
jgi:hypothetical protein